MHFEVIMKDKELCYSIIMKHTAGEGYGKIANHLHLPKDTRYMKRSGRPTKPSARIKS